MRSSSGRLSPSIIYLAFSSYPNQHIFHYQAQHLLCIWNLHAMNIWRRNCIVPAFFIGHAFFGSVCTKLLRPQVHWVLLLHRSWGYRWTYSKGYEAQGGEGETEDTTYLALPWTWGETDTHYSIGGSRASWESLLYPVNILTMVGGPREQQHSFIWLVSRHQSKTKKESFTLWSQFPLDGGWCSLYTPDLSLS